MNPQNKKILLICGAVLLLLVLVLILTTCIRARNKKSHSSSVPSGESISEETSSQASDYSSAEPSEATETSDEDSSEDDASSETEGSSVGANEEESSKAEESSGETAEDTEAESAQEKTEGTTGERDETTAPVITPTSTPKPTPTSTPKPTPSSTPKPTPSSTPKPTATPVPTATPADTGSSGETKVPISDLALQYGFTLGGCIGNSQMNNTAYKNMITENFDSVTATNELKAYSLLSWKSQYSTNGMPVMDYTNADKIVAWAQANGIGVRGHVLVWDAYMTDWFFREGYRSTGAYVDKETMKARLEYYINDVITHFETKYPGVVYCWDVVNEAVGDSSSDYNSSDPRHIRITRSGSENLFYKYVGEDYVELSFLYARNTLDRLGSDTKLFYNDYNTFYPEKRDAICHLVNSINTYATDSNGNYRKLCDGIGMQGYIGGFGTQNGCMNSGDLSRIETAIVTYASLGLDVHVTEMAVRNYDPSAATMAQHAAFYADLFEVFISANQKTGGALKNVTIWGLHDNPSLSTGDYSYTMNGPYCGLFDQNYKPKSSYYAVYEVLE